MINAKKEYSGCLGRGGNLEQRLPIGPNEAEAVTFQLMPEGSVGINQVNWGRRGRKRISGRGKRISGRENTCAKPQRYSIRTRNF